MKEWNELMKTRETRDESPMKPQVVAAAVNELLRDDAIVTTDSGTITTWAARHIHMRRGMKFSCSGNLATMAPGLALRHRGARRRIPAARSSRSSATAGSRCSWREFVTAVKHKLPIKVIIIKNNVLGQIKWEQMIFLGNPEYGVELQPIDFVKFAEACGGVGFRCEIAGGGARRARGGLRVEEAGARGSGGRPLRAAHARARRPPSRAVQLAESRWCAASPTASRSPPRSS